MLQGNEGDAAQAMQNALQGLNIPERSVSPAHVLIEHHQMEPQAVQNALGGLERSPAHVLIEHHQIEPLDNDTEQENEDEIVHVENVLSHDIIIDSLNSSYEDLSNANPQMRQVLHIVSTKPDDEGESAQSGRGMAGGVKKDKSDTGVQDVNSELDNANDSSGEEDAGNYKYKTWLLLACVN